MAGVAGSVNGGRDRTRVCLTLDDGPDPHITPAVLDALAARNARCTFFLLTDQARARPDLARRIAGAGHEVALHGRDHRPMTGLSARTVRRYLTGARHELQDLVQQPVGLYRPPYGAQSPRSYLGARQAGLEVVVWSGDAADWVDRPGSQVVTDALRGAEPGAILLFHERLEPHPTRGAPTTSFDRADAVAGIVDGILERGLIPSTVGDLSEHRRTTWFRP
nr:polysaccharide deacetylase family protein [Kineosporia mesophila]